MTGGQGCSPVLPRGRIMVYAFGPFTLDTHRRELCDAAQHLVIDHILIAQLNDRPALNVKRFVR